jgi:hypothetical protein
MLYLWLRLILLLRPVHGLLRILNMVRSFARPSSLFVEGGSATSAFFGGLRADLRLC